MITRNAMRALRSVTVARRAAAVIALAAIVAASAPAGAQEIDPRLAARLDARTAAEVQASATAARAAGLPVEPLVLKALEGASKGARGPQIVAAVARLQARLGEARTALGAASTADEITNGAAALQAGIEPATLRALRSARARGSLETALAVLTDLAARGVPVADASAVVLGLIERGAGDDQLVAVRADVERDIRGGMPPAAAAARQRRGPPAGLPVPPGKKAPPGKGGGPPPLMP